MPSTTKSLANKCFEPTRRSKQRAAQTWRYLFMKQTAALLVSVSVLAMQVRAETLCFSPVREKAGDKSTTRTWSQPFDYQVQIDDGPVIKPSADKSTSYEFRSNDPYVKIWLGDRVVESFRVPRAQIIEGRDCIYFKNLYETWSVVETRQAKKFCSCAHKKT